MRYLLVSTFDEFISDSIGKRISNRRNWTFSRDFPEEVTKKNWWNQFCGKAITSNFVKQSMKEWTDNLIIAYRKNKMVGFASIWIERNYLYLNLICTLKGSGARLLNEIEDLAKKTLRKKYIKLSAVPYVVNYYRRLGYKHSNYCPISTAIKKIEEKAIKVAHLKFESDSDARKHPDFKDFMNFLQKNKMGNQINGFTMVKCL